MMRSILAELSQLVSGEIWDSSALNCDARHRLCQSAARGRFRLDRDAAPRACFGQEEGHCCGGNGQECEKGEDA